MNAELLELQGQAALKAVELDPKLAVAHARLGQYYKQIQQYEKGDAETRIAASLDPDDPLVLGFGAMDAMWNGDIPGATELWRRAVAQDPLSPTVRGNYAYFLHLDGQLEAALVENRRALELNPDAGPELGAEIARLLILLGRHDEATAVIARLPEGHSRDRALALLHRAPGQRAESDAALERLTATAGTTLERIHLAEVLVYRGQRDKALEILLEYGQRLEREIDQRPRDWWRFQEELRMAPLLQPLHDDPRWAALTDMSAGDL